MGKFSLDELNKDSDDILYVDYVDESMLPDIQALVSRDLSEPYSVFTYRYFLHACPDLCICAYAKSSDATNAGGRGAMIGTIVCRVDQEESFSKGYVAMLTVANAYRKRGIGIKLASAGIERMVMKGCEEICLEAEATNVGALSLYDKLGFVRDEKLTRYYLNGNDAYRLKMWVDKRPEE